MVAFPLSVPAKTATISDLCSFTLSHILRSPVLLVPENRAVITVTPLISFAFSNIPSTWLEANFDWRDSMLLSLSMISAIICSDFFTKSCGLFNFNTSAACCIDARELLSRFITPCPVTASMRRTPAATELSDTILNMPILEVLSTCVPPQNSLE